MRSFTSLCSFKVFKSIYIYVNQCIISAIGLALFTHAHHDRAALEICVKFNFFKAGLRRPPHGLVFYDWLATLWEGEVERVKLCILGLALCGRQIPSCNGIQ